MVEETIKNIEASLDWYAKNCEVATIKDLMRMSDKVSIWSVTLASIVAQADGHYLIDYFNRRCYEAERQSFHVANGDSQAISKEKALLETKNSGLRQNEIDSQVAAKSSQLMLRQVNKVLDSVRQRISFLKMEYESQKYLNNTQNQNSNDNNRY